jgi:hypothetical protein
VFRQPQLIVAGSKTTSRLRSSTKARNRTRVVMQIQNAVSTALYRKGAVAKLTENRRHHTEIARYFSGLNSTGTS